MRIRLIKIGKVVLPVKPLLELYEGRLRAFGKFEYQEAKNVEQAEKMLEESKSNSSSYLVVLDERGKQMSSPSLAQFISRQLEDTRIKALTFVVGGPYGVGTGLRQKAGLVWSLSDGVLPSDLAWVVLHEQLYRAFTILAGTPYHHG